MPRALAGLQPEKVFYYFEQICSIPHGSGNTGKIADYLMFFAKAHSLEAKKDKLNNVVIRKEASGGYQEAPAVILQGHTDMVCAKVPGSAHDFAKDGLSLRVEDGWIKADGTTLGGDDGIAVAMMLAILADEELDHPALEAVFTTDEETGMFGAKALDMDELQGRLLLNMDSEEEGVLTVACAGGSKTTVRAPFARKKPEGKAFTVRITGLTGGHSGAEIHKGRANAAILAGRFLRDTGLSAVSLNGGSADNAIMPECLLTVCGAGDIPALCAKEEQAFRAAFPEEDIRLICEPSDEEARGMETDLGALLGELPYGVQSMSKDIDGLVQTSLNVGIVRTEKDVLTMTYSVRSSVNKEKDELNAKLKTVAAKFGGKAETNGAYPAWEYRKESPLRDRMAEIYRKKYGKEMKIEAIHAGLECGLFYDGIEDLDAVSFGPDMRAIHTPAEQLSVASVARTYDYVLAVLKSLKQW